MVIFKYIYRYIQQLPCYMAMYRGQVWRRGAVGFFGGGGSPLIVVVVVVVTAEASGEIVHRVDCRPRLHGRRPIQQSPVTVLCELHQEDLEEHLCKLFAHAHA